MPTAFTVWVCNMKPDGGELLGVESAGYVPKGCALPAYVASEETDLIPYRKDAPKTETEQETV